MFNRAVTLFKQKQPISITGVLRHIILWLTSGIDDIIFENPHYKPSDHPESDPVLLGVHGTADRVNSFILFSQRILNHLPSSVRYIHLVSFSKRAKGVGIEEYVNQLKNKINKAGYKKLILAGHSRGCLVVADYAENFAADENVQIDAVIAVCGPFEGSAMALPPLSLISDSVAQMKIGSDYIVNLRKKIEVSIIPYLCFAAENDGLVSIMSSRAPAPSASIIILDRHGHLSILSSQRLVNFALDFLERVYAKKISVDLPTIEDYRPIKAISLAEHDVKDSEADMPELYSAEDVKRLVNGNGTEFDRYLSTKFSHSSKLLQYVLSEIKNECDPVRVASFTSMISRCIENGSNPHILMDLLNFCKDNEISGPLYLRRVSNSDYLSLAAVYGFHDPELSKRIVLAQRLIKKQEPPVITYEGRQPGDNEGYFGYRHAMYFIRYNPKQRLKLFEHCDWGDCNWQAYADLLGDEISQDVYKKINRKS